MSDHACHRWVTVPDATVNGGKSPIPLPFLPYCPLCPQLCGSNSHTGRGIHHQYAMDCVACVNALSKLQTIGGDCGSVDSRGVAA